ncbi:phosphoribosylamine--glycine ligase [Phaeocystidibacter marisrubri]|uniref:Phosphoribosylamine--glycine ligase n=1 Tax=Phaeocystidibacter marisrubri TaxID=1577780 RepID=A0A6L3ZCJ2_9FLAO|nr:phosphoribosylamine--glycine ligase [Phaeocystidibacter marisrubri]KAB2815157.1 phosphoribosylamine--glycine ligase [Phaeocystidibacter marisrubri]GGH70624.1 phosphoribosylamine--glycine ligase [Phaeocystidibacter marisrubri]
MNILVIGSGGREHAISWKISQSSMCDKLFIAPGNPGTAQVGENVPMDVSDFAVVADFIRSNSVEIVLVGPEDPLVNGIHDYLIDTEGLDITVIGPRKEGAQLEGSKDFSKQFMMRHDIPTAKYQTFTSDDIEKGYAFLESLEAPYVLKADGLAAGKGVLILNDLQEAKDELRSMLVDAKFGNASAQVVIEEFLSGIEFSVFALTDGKDYVILPEAKDYKRIGEGDTGLNTGGMGAVSPVPFVDDVMMEKVVSRIVEPTITGLAKEKIPYVGFVFFGLISVNGEPFVIEYNCRMGDPETEVVMPRLKSDLVSLLKAAGNGTLSKEVVEFDDRSATTVMVVSGGYPESYQKGCAISGLENVENCLVFHAGTTMQDGKLVTSGGRVMAFTAYGSDKKKALEQSYEGVKRICFDNINYRKDIGFDL